MSAAAIKILKKRMEETRNDMRRVGKNALKNAFDEFFEQAPEVEAIVWTQYTPYFNDGDTCEFSVHELNLKLNRATRSRLSGEDITAGDQQDWIREVYDSDEYSLRSSKVARDQEVLRLFNTFVGDIQDEELFQMTFGDHVRVIARAGRIDTEEHSHD